MNSLPEVFCDGVENVWKGEGYLLVKRCHEAVEVKDHLSPKCEPLDGVTL